MFSMTVAEVVQAKQALVDILAEKMPVDTAYRLVKIVKIINNEMETYDQVRGKLFKEMGEDVKDRPGERAIKEENMEEFQKQIKELLDKKFEVAMEPIKLADLGEKFEVKPATIMLLGPIIKD